MQAADAGDGVGRGSLYNKQSPLILGLSVISSFTIPPCDAPPCTLLRSPAIQRQHRSSDGSGSSSHEGRSAVFSINGASVIPQLRLPAASWPLRAPLSGGDLATSIHSATYLS